MPHKTLVIGILGGIGCGKSRVAAMLGNRGAVVLNADALAREVTDEPEIVESIRRRFGDDVIGSDGRVDRDALADLVFGDGADEERAALNGIIHPRVRERIVNGIHDARARGETLIVLDVPLLLESPLGDECDHFVFVRSSTETRLERVRDRGWDRDELARREAAQTPLAEKERVADAVVSNDGSVAELEREIDRLVDGLTRDESSGDRHG